MSDSEIKATASKAYRPVAKNLARFTVTRNDRVADQEERRGRKTGDHREQSQHARGGPQRAHRSVGSELTKRRGLRPVDAELFAALRVDEPRTGRRLRFAHQRARARTLKIPHYVLALLVNLQQDEGVRAGELELLHRAGELNRVFLIEHCEGVMSNGRSAQRYQATRYYECSQLPSHTNLPCFCFKAE